MRNPLSTVRSWLQRRSSVVNPDSWLLRMLGGYPTTSGANVSERTALQCGAFLVGSRILAETVAVLPLKVWRRLPSGGKEAATDHPLYDVLHLNPNEEYTSFEWRERMMIDCCGWGNSYNQVLYDGKMNVREVWPLEASRMSVTRPDPAGPKVYSYRRPGQSDRIFDPEEILHISLLGDGLKGQSLLNLCREAVGLTLTAEEFVAAFFRNDASPRLVFETDQPLGKDKTAEMRASWEERHQGAKRAHRAAWLWGGMKARLLEADLSKLGLIEIRKFQLEEIARILRVPLHLMQSLDRATNNNIEHQGIDFVVHAIMPWLVRIEQRISKTLFGPRESSTYFAEFNADGLLRGDFVSRTTGYSRMIASAMLKPNEGRALENLNPEPGGDELFIQGAMLPLRLAGAKFAQKQQNGQPAAAA
jgi:HK97 family phage portal protein